MNTNASSSHRSAYSRTSWLWRLTLGVALGVIFVLLVKHYDLTLMRMRYAVIGDRPRGFFQQTVEGFRQFGQVLAAVVIMLVVIVQDRRWKTILATLLLAELFGAMVYYPAKATIIRYRPQRAIEVLAPAGSDLNDKDTILREMSWKDTWQGIHLGNGDSGQQSFPSGHSAGAFVLAGVLSIFYPRLAWLFWVLATGCAASRFADAVHWPSDCLAGATLGYLAARLSAAICVKKSPRNTF